LGALEEFQRRYDKDVAYFVVYFEEAHPEGGWVLRRNRRADLRVRDPATDEEREAVAQTCALRVRLAIPVLSDRLDNAVASAYGGWPDRLYLIGCDGRVAFQGREGLFGFKPPELEAAIRAELGKAS
jgi:Iodothyronine deiodinase